MKRAITNTVLVLLGLNITLHYLPFFENDPDIWRMPFIFLAALSNVFVYGLFGVILLLVTGNKAKSIVYFMYALASSVVMIIQPLLFIKSAWALIGIIPFILMFVTPFVAFNIKNFMIRKYYVFSSLTLVIVKVIKISIPLLVVLFGLEGYIYHDLQDIPLFLLDLVNFYCLYQLGEVWSDYE